jgi:hypothetical protein
MSSSSDCLVLMIEEYDIDNVRTDNTVYVLYDQKDEQYVIRGKRNDTKNIKGCCFSFNCKNIKSLEYFISFIICKNNLWNFTLYNYDNLPYRSENITYDYLSDNASSEIELSGYDKTNYSKEKLKNLLKTIKNVFNNYN